MRRPPDAVVLVARAHGVVSATIAASVVGLHFFTQKLPFVAFGAKTYLISGGLCALYGVAGMLVWCGAPFGRLLSRVCGLLYLARPRLGSHLWEIMNSPEFQAHFRRTAGTTRP